MRIFVVSDTHDVPISELELISKEAKKRECECIIHCGDLEDAHLGHPALGDLPIWVYLTNLNERVPATLPSNWHLLQNDERQVIEFGVKKKTRIYVNHYLGVEVLRSQLGFPSLQAAASELLAVVQNATDPAERALALRSYLDLTDNQDLPATRRVALCKQAAPLIQSAEQKRLFLAALGRIPSPDAFDLILPHLADEAIRAEAGTAVLNVAERLLKGQNAPKVAPRLIAPLEKVAEATAGTESMRTSGPMAPRSSHCGLRTKCAVTTLSAFMVMVSGLVVPGA